MPVGPGLVLGEAGGRCAIGLVERGLRLPRENSEAGKDHITVCRARIGLISQSPGSEQTANARHCCALIREVT
jgi:hypothetical protein